MIIDDSLSSLFRHFRNYLVGDVGVKIITLLFWPALTFLLTPADFGVIAVFNTTLVLIIPLLSLNTHTAISRYYFEQQGDFGGFLASITLFTLVTMLSLGILLFAKPEILTSILKLPDELYIYLLPLAILLAIGSVYSQICRTTEQSAALIRINLATAVLYMALTFIFIFWLIAPGYKGVILANLSAQAIICVIVGFRILKLLEPIQMRNSHLSYALSYGIPLIPYTLSSEILASFDVLMINAYEGADRAGIYSLGYRIGALLLVVISALNSAWTPKYMRYMNEDHPEKHEHFSRQLLKVITAIGVLLICFGDIGLSLISAVAFSESVKVIPIVAAGYCFYMLFVIYNKHTTYVKKLIFQSIVTVLGGVVNIGLNTLFIPRYGYMAAAYTTLASFALMALLSYLVNSFYIKKPAILLRTSLAFVLPIVLLIGVKQIVFLLNINIVGNLILSSLFAVATILLYYHPAIRIFKIPAYE